MRRLLILFLGMFTFNGMYGMNIAGEVKRHVGEAQWEAFAQWIDTVPEKDADLLVGEIADCGTVLMKNDDSGDSLFCRLLFQAYQLRSGNIKGKNKDSSSMAEHVLLWLLSQKKISYDPAALDKLNTGKNNQPVTQYFNKYIKPNVHDLTVPRVVRRPVLWIVIGTVLVAGAVVGGYMWYQKQQKKAEDRQGDESLPTKCSNQRQERV